MEYSPDFWVFYKLNSKYVEAILHGICEKYHSDKIDFDDLHQELLLNLKNSDFLSKFDPTRAKLSTYFYSQAQYRASHVVTSMKASMKENKLGTPVYLDHGKDFGDGDVYEEIEDTKIAATDSAIEEKDFKSNIYGALTSNHLKEVLSFIEEGYNLSEISKMYGVSRMALSYQFVKIKKSVKKSMYKESVLSL